MGSWKILVGLACVAAVGCSGQRARTVEAKLVRDTESSRRRPTERNESRAPAQLTGVDGYGVTKGGRALWVCEVEASQKVFTGLGGSQGEASDAARSTCSSHLQSSYCSKTECKKRI